MANAKPVFTNDALALFEATDPALLQRALGEYLKESDHQNWEGYTRSDLTGVRRFIADFALALQNGAGS